MTDHTGRLETWILSASEKRLRFIAYALMSATLQALKSLPKQEDSQDVLRLLSNAIAFSILVKENCTEHASLDGWLTKEISQEQLIMLLQKLDSDISL